MVARPVRVTFNLPAADPDGICTPQWLGAAAAFSVDGALVASGVATLSPPRHVSVASVGDDSGVTFSVLGTDRYGAALQEDIPGANAGTATGEKNFATVTAVTTSGVTAGNVSVGSANAGETAWLPIEQSEGASVTIGSFEGSGATATVQHTAQNVWGTHFDEHNASPQNMPLVTAVTAEQGSPSTFLYWPPFAAFRLRLYGFSSDASATITIITAR